MVPDSVCLFIEQGIIRHICEGAACGRFLHAMAGLADIMELDVGDYAMIDTVYTVRWHSMAVCADQSKIDNLSMAADTATGNPSNAIQSCSVTEGAGLLDIPGRIVVSIIRWSGPGDRMGRIGRISRIDTRGMTRFTTIAKDSDIESWIASRSAGRIVRVTGLAYSQV